jgi:hypothetical protein
MIPKTKICTKCKIENVKIYDSYLIKGIRKKLSLIKEIRVRYCQFIWNRSNFSLLVEWIIHNFAYDLNILRTRTKDVDFDKHWIKSFFNSFKKRKS